MPYLTNHIFTQYRIHWLYSEQVRFHLSGSAALSSAVLLARVNTGRPMLLVFGGNAHGWTDGVAQEGIALGEVRYACDVITAR